MYYPSKKIHSEDVYFQALITEIKEKYPNFSAKSVFEEWEKAGNLRIVSIATLSNIFSAINKKDSCNFSYDNADRISECLGYGNFLGFLKKYCEENNITYQVEKSGSLCILSQNIQQTEEIIIPETQETEEIIIPEIIENKPSFKLKKYVYLAISMFFGIISIIVFWFYIFSKNKKELEPKYILEFVPRKSTTERTIEIDYDVSQINSNNIELHAGYNPNPHFLRKLDKKKGKVSFFLMNPDNRPLYLYVDGKHHDTKNFLYVTTPDWSSNIGHTYKENNIEKSNLGNPLLKEDFYHKDFLGLIKPLATTSSSNYWLHFRYFNEKLHQFLGNDFTFETEMSNSEKHRGISCYDSFIFVCTEKEYMKVNFVEENCDAYGYIHIRNDKIDKEHNPEKARVLKKNFQEFRKVKVISKNNVFSVYYENKLLYELPFSEKNLGKIKGIIIGFKGAGGRVKYAKLSNEHEEYKLF